MIFLCFFFFQAEDGIRDLVRSRGLGDVYKRQVSTQSTGATTTNMAAAELEGIKGQLVDLIGSCITEDAKFGDIDSKEVAKEISEKSMALLMDQPLLEGYKMFVKAVILQVNGMAASSNTLWSAQDYNLSVSWSNEAKCAVWLTVIANPNPPSLPQ
eukprot:TRINITY_DN2848_c0_g1_i1.p1 TRINITY_DN2848_c0_g1~~TRINITY_DN2848_c0_g1_i1.p1  ORF type:complete len:156 (-),score=51.62 TRINITY_DN2848_c0_g1_i1:287-754(-)